MDINSLGFLTNTYTTEPQKVAADDNFGQLFMDTMSQALNEKVLNTTAQTDGQTPSQAGNSLDQMQPYILAAAVNEDISAQQSTMLFMLSMMAQEFEGSEMGYLMDVFSAAQNSIE